LDAPKLASSSPVPVKINPEAAPIRQALPMSMRQIASGFPFRRLRRFTADRRMHGPLALAETNAVTPRSVGRDAHSMTSLEPGPAWILRGRRYERPLLRIALLMGLLWNPMVFPSILPQMSIDRLKNDARADYGQLCGSQL
jgi:hypothetical protein